jgi:protocatechuate 3,4-dioxygenase alpha subunit
MAFTPTPSQTAGPFLHLGLTDHHSVSRMAGHDVEGEHVWMTVRVLDGDGAPISDAMIELWQGDSTGNYPNQSSSTQQSFTGFGRMATNEDGSCTFETIKPGRVPGPAGKRQAPHINVSIFGRGLQNRLTTRLYFANDPANSEDPTLALVPESRRSTLFARPDALQTGRWSFEIRLRGEGETVFFDV